MIARLPEVHVQRSFDPELLQELARATYDAARKSWQQICVPDDEP